jgi:hypothetical protein
VSYVLKVLGYMSVAFGLLSFAIVLGFIWLTNGSEAMLALISHRNVLASVATLAPGIMAVFIAMWMERRRQ